MYSVSYEFWAMGESSFRHALFQVVSGNYLTTGFVSADFYGNVDTFLTVFFFRIIFLGGSAGSLTAGR